MRRGISNLLTSQKPVKIILHLLICKPIRTKTIKSNQSSKRNYFNKSPYWISTIVFIYNVTAIYISFISVNLTIANFSLYFTQRIQIILNYLISILIKLIHHTQELQLCVMLNIQSHMYNTISQFHIYHSQNLKLVITLIADRAGNTKRAVITAIIRLYTLVFLPMNV